MRLSKMIGIFGAVSLAMPAMQLEANDGSITIASCGNLPPVTLNIPGKKKPLPDDGYCKQACHAASDRKKKGQQAGRC